MNKYTCGYCSKEDQYDPKTAVVLRARQEKDTTGNEAVYHVIRCNHCGKRNEVKPAKDG